MTDLTEEIIELQTRIQFQEDVIQKLDSEVIRQGELLERLVRRMAELEDRLEQLRFDREQPGAADSEKPPHY